MSASMNTTSTKRAPVADTTVVKRTKHTANQVRLVSEVDTGALQIITRTDANGRPKIYTNYGTDRFVLETPWLPCYGLDNGGKYAAESAYPKYTFRCNLQDHADEESEHAQFMRMMDRVDSKVVDEAVKNSVAWGIKKATSREVVIGAMLNPSVKVPTDPRWSPDFKMKVPCFDGEWPVAAYKVVEGGHEQLTGDLFEQVKGKMEVKAIIECTGVWVFNGKLGCTWTVRQFQYRSHAHAALSPTAYAFDTTVPTSIDATSLQIQEMKVVVEDTGFRRAYVNAGDGSHVYLQTPWLKSPGGICEPKPEFNTSGVPKFGLSFVLDGFRGEDEEVATFYTQLRAMDDRFIDYATEQSADIFGKTTSKAVVEALYNRMVDPHEKEDGTENVWFQTKVPYRDGQFECAAFPETSEDDAAKDRVCHTTDLQDHVAGKVYARVILKCKGIWCASGRVGCNWQVVQVEYRAGGKANTQPQYGFREPMVVRVSGDDAVPTDDAKTAVDAAPTDNGKTVAVYEEDEDDCIVDSEEDE